MNSNSAREIIDYIRSLPDKTPTPNPHTFTFSQWSTKAPLATEIRTGIQNAEQVSNVQRIDSGSVFLFVFLFLLVVISIIIIAIDEKKSKERAKLNGGIDPVRQKMEEDRKNRQLERIRKKELKYQREKELKILHLQGYRNGYEYEVYVSKRLAIDGWKNITVTSKSGDYGADIIATSPDGTKYAIQCKMVHGSVGYKAVQEVLSGMVVYRCSRALVITTGTFTKQAIDGANKIGIQLIENYR